MKNSIKRAQSQARLSFAERENFRPKVRQLKKTLLTLVALLAMTTGAWAQTETLLTTITPTGTGTYSETTSGVVTVTHDNDDYDGTYGWLWYFQAGSITVEAKDGYTITKCVFSQPYDKAPVTVSTAPFKVNFVYNDEYEQYICEGTDPDEGMNGVASIEVYGYAPSASSGPEVTWTAATKTGSFTMPGGNVTLEPDYYPQATAAEGAVTAATDVKATTDAPLVTIDETKLTGAKKLMYFVSNSGTTAPAYDAEGWTDVLPTAENYTEAANLNVWYYPVGTEEGVDEATATYSDGDICATALTVSLGAAPTYAVTFADDLTEPDKWTASPAADVTKGQTVTVTYTGSKKVIGVKAEKKAAAPVPITVTWNNNDITGTWGKSFTKDGVTITAGFIDFDDKNFMEGGTFSTTLGNFTKIEVTTGVWNASGTGWSGSGQSGTWTGNASSVSFSGDIMGMAMGNTKFVFTIEPTN